MNSTRSLLVNAAHDDARKITHIQGLAHIAAVAWNGEHRHLAHEARKPTQVLAVKPAKHQGGAQHHAGDAAGEHQVFLLLLGIGVKVIDDRLHNRRADVHQIRHIELLHRFQYALRGLHVVAQKLLVVDTANLGLQHDDSRSAVQMRLPLTRLRQVSLHRRYAGVQRAQDVQVRMVLVDHHQIHVPSIDQAIEQVLPDQARATTKDYFF